MPFLDGPAIAADIEFGAASMPYMVVFHAGHKRIERFDLVNKPRRHQKIQRAVDGGRLGLSIGAQLLKQIIGLDRAFGLQHQPEDAAARWSELFSAFAAKRLGVVERAFYGIGRVHSVQI